MTPKLLEALAMRLIDEGSSITAEAGITGYLAVEPEFYAAMVSKPVAKSLLGPDSTFT